jgi:hypothetical protein
MKHLAALQRDFICDLLEDGTRSVLPAISSTGSARPVKQFAIYANAYRQRLNEVLRQDYPALRTLLGDHTFEAVADAYIARHPSRYYSLRDFGTWLSVFLNNQKEYRDIPACVEMANFEWQLGLAFDASDDPSVTIEMMNDIPDTSWPDLRFIFHSSSHVMDLSWNTPELWQAYKIDSLLPEAKFYTPPVSWLIWRQDQKVHFRSQETDETALFNSAKQGDTFEEMCEALSTIIAPENVPFRAASLLKRWVHDGLISRIVYS